MAFPENEERLSKLEYASFFAACLSWLVTSKNDRVSLTVFDQGIRKHIPPGSTRRHLHDLMTTLETTKPGSPTDLPDALHRAHPLLKRRGTLVILSDLFTDPARLFTALNPYLHRGFRVHLFHLLDPDELKLPDRGLSRFVDMESDARLTAHPASVRAAWDAEVLSHSRALRSLAASRHTDYFLTSTADSYFSLFDRLRSH